MIGIGSFLGLVQLGETAPPGPGPAGFYPAVPPADLAAAGGSLRFPENNHELSQAGVTGYKAGLVQTGAANLIVGGALPGALAAIIRLPIDKRVARNGNDILGICGNGHGGSNQVGLVLYPADFNGASVKNRLAFWQRSTSGSAASLISQPLTEDAALVVAWHDTANNWQLDWYSLKDGTRHAGDVVVPSATVNSPSATAFGIGQLGSETTFAAQGVAAASLWPGEIAAIYSIADATVTPEQWAQVALGASIGDFVAGSKFRYVREMHGGSGLMTKPAWATGDTRAAPVPRTGATPAIGDSAFWPGSTLRRQSPGQYLTMDGISHGWVYGLTATGATCDVPFAGDAGGHAGDVEVRVFEAGSGRVVRDWTVVGAISDGRWSGRLTLPKGEDWWFAEARPAAAPAMVWTRRDHFAVGYKFLVVGQSTTKIPLAGGSVGLPMGQPMSASFLTLQVMGTRAAAGEAARLRNMGRIGVRFASDGRVAFVNQLRAMDPKTPVMLIDEAVNGTSMMGLISGAVDSGTDRQWADLTDKLAVYGNDVTAVLFNWAANESLTYGTIAQGCEAFFFGTGPLAPATGHCLAHVLRPGWTACNLTRSRAQSSNPFGDVLQARMDFFAARGFAQSPPAIDNRLDPPEAGHQDPDSLLGCARFMQRFAVGAARSLGLDASQEPYFDNPVRAGATITIDCVAVNGGAVASPAPHALRSWHVKEPADGDYLAVGSGRFTAVLTGGKVVLTRTSGTWPAGTMVWFMSAGEQRTANTDAEEDAILAGMIYESWPADPLGDGMLLCGTRDGAGTWRLEFREPVS